MINILISAIIYRGYHNKYYIEVYRIIFKYKFKKSIDRTFKIRIDTFFYRPTNFVRYKGSTTNVYLTVLYHI